MQSPREVSLNSLAAQAYTAGFQLHGDLDLHLGAYLEHLAFVIRKRFGEDPQQAAALDFFHTLHTSDLYLSVACGEGADVAWDHFWAIYERRIWEIANSVSRSRSEASDVADNILAHLYLPDRSGRSRIASFDGRCSLEAWLRCVINHKAIEDRELKWNSIERLDDLPEIADVAAIDKVENELQADTYESLINDSLLEAGRSISEREQLMLSLRFKRALRRTEIAQLTGVHPSTVTRQLQQTRETLRDRIISTLSSKHGLSAPAIDECVADILSNPAYSLLGSW